MLSELQRRKLSNLFALHDLDGDGYIEEDDWETYTGNICAAKGVDPGTADYDAILAGFMSEWNTLKGHADPDGDGRVDLEAWYSFVDGMLEAKGGYEGYAGPIVGSIFSMLDRDGDGMVSEDEYVAVWQAGAHDGAGAPTTYARLMGDHDRGMSLDEMHTLVERFFRSQDPDDPANLFFGPVEV